MHDKRHKTMVKLMLRLNFNKIKIKSLVACSISEGRVDQKQIFNFVRPDYNSLTSEIFRSLWLNVRLLMHYLSNAVQSSQVTIRL